MRKIDVKHLKIYIVIELVVVSILCYILHFAFEKSGNSIALASLVNVNESVWEHLKLPTTSFILFALATYIVNRKIENYNVALCIKIIMCMILIPLIYYCFKMLGYENRLVNVASLYISVIIAEIYEYYIITRGVLDKKYNSTAIIIILIIQILFVIFTFHPLKLDIFRDSRYNSYGIIKNKEEL